MAQLTIGGLVDELAVAVGQGSASSDDIRVSLARHIDWAGQLVWERHPWAERLVEKPVTLIVPYTTGTAAVTVGSTGVVGTGTTWTSAMIGRRFALSYGGPWYRITAVGSTTALTLDHAYVEATNASATYCIYMDEYSLDTSIETTRHVNLLNATYGGQMPRLEEKTLDDFASIPTTTGVPRIWCNTQPLASAPSVRRIRVWPIPTTAYTIRTTGLSFWTHSTTEADTPPFHQDREPVVLFAAKYQAERLISGQEQTVGLQEVLGLIDTAWQMSQKTRPRSLRMRGLNAGPRHRGPRYGPWVTS